MADESVLIQLQHKKRKGGSLAFVGSVSRTVRGFSLEAVQNLIKETFKAELDGSKVGLFKRPDDKVLAMLTHFKRDPKTNTLKYAGVKSLTIDNINLKTALRRVEAAVSNLK